jgi:hypothetical protein
MLGVDWATVEMENRETRSVQSTATRASIKAPYPKSDFGTAASLLPKGKADF